jgi:hypothetical protein
MGGGGLREEEKAAADPNRHREEVGRNEEGSSDPKGR